eukprot:TRINITY_DN13767_c0_g1_i2.p1 TRINITY_DN13767_c0_g1~~TRINITY_DN13767_c0_g1_i2.p1  ORF type:complete len:113 (+),score=20.26 TRINITY_DN13767_c0_g1_i2:119-457(+)
MHRMNKTFVPLVKTVNNNKASKAPIKLKRKNVSLKHCLMSKTHKRLNQTMNREQKHTPVSLATMANLNAKMVIQVRGADRSVKKVTTLKSFLRSIQKHAAKCPALVNTLLKA